MIDKFRILLHVKELRESERARAVQVARRRVDEARTQMKNAESAMRRNEAAMAERERKAYAEIIRKSVSLPRIDEVKHKVLELCSEQQRFVDKFERAQHVVETRMAELEQCRIAHQAAIIARDKYQMTTDELATAARIASEAAEEAELEDLSSRQIRIVP